MGGYYPWQATQWQQLQRRRQQERLPHALLLTGPTGLGKLEFGLWLAQSLLCSSPGLEGEACGQCRSCQQFQAQSHPDFLLVAPVEAGKSITVDQARGVGEYLSMSSHYEGFKVVLIHPAEQMNINAANSLLKTLEEPNARRMLILVSDRPSALLPTIRSRCQSLAFHHPDTETAERFLQPQLQDSDEIRLLLALCNNAPLRALAMHEQGGIEQRGELFADFIALFQGRITAVALAERWSKAYDARTLFSLMQSWLMDMLRLKSTDNPSWLNNPDLRAALQNLVKGLNWETISQQLQKVNEANRPGIFSSNLQLWLEDWLIVLSNAYQSNRAA